MHFAHALLVGLIATSPVGPAMDASVQAGNLSMVHTVQASPIEVVQPTATSLVMDLDGVLVMVDPVGAQEMYRRFGRPDIVVLTRADPAFLSVDTMIGLLRRDTVVLAPQSVIDVLPLMISNNTVAPFEPGTRQTVGGIAFTARDPAYQPPAGTHTIDRPRGDIAVVMTQAGWALAF